MHRAVKRAANLALAAAPLAGLGCSERLAGGNACPILCPGQTVELRDTLLAAVSLDASISGFPPIGEEPALVLTSRGDTLDTRVIIRYDTLPTTYRPPNSPTDTPIDLVEDARLQIRLAFPAQQPDQPMTVEAYDVDTTTADGADTTAASIVPLFRPDRFLGSVTFTPTEIATTPAPGATTPDSLVRIPIDNAYLLAKIQAKGRLRVGLLLRSDASAELVFQGLNWPRPVDISFRVSADAAVARRSASPNSATPAERFVAAQLSDFVIVAQRRPPDTPAQILAVGGVPGKRTYFRFDLPSKIIDSTSVVRATLLLTQYPNRLAANPADSLSVYPLPVAASERVTDIRAAAGILVPIFNPAFRELFPLDSLRTAPDDSGTVEIEVVGAVQTWRSFLPAQASRALVLRMPPVSEGAAQDELYFFSTRAAEELRPRLRIVYVPRIGFALP
jgi:hypothetical protein